MSIAAAILDSGYLHFSEFEEVLIVNAQWADSKGEEDLEHDSSLVEPGEISLRGLSEASCCDLYL